tara:strand:+ start:130 stop:297 length:168 start_codon:yes stop_codon:yes gene_type:complete
MACKGCKKKPLNDLNEFPIKKEKNEKLVFILIMFYTLLAGYGLIRLILDIKNLFI